MMSYHFHINQSDNYDSDVTEIPAINIPKSKRKEEIQPKARKRAKKNIKKIQKNSVIELSESEQSDISNEDNENDETLKINRPNRTPEITEKDRLHFGDASKWNDIKDASFSEKGKRIYGYIEPVLTTYEKRLDCSCTKTHRPPQVSCCHISIILFL